MNRLKIRNTVLPLILAFFLAVTSFEQPKAQAQESKSNANEEDFEAVMSEIGYQEMQKQWEQQGIVRITDQSYIVQADAYSYPEQEPKSTQNMPQGYDNSAVPMQAGDKISFSVNADKEGLYRIRLDYAMDEACNSDASLSMEQENLVPYKEARGIVLTRMLTPEPYPYERDRKGNEIVPDVSVAPVWQTSNLRTLSQKTTDSLLFHLKAGENNFSLMVNQGSFYLGNLYVEGYQEPESYEQYKKNHDSKEEGEAELIVLEAEQMDFKNSTTPRPVAARDVESVPYESSTYMMSVIGGETWQNNGEALYYQVDIKKEGWYNISFKTKQTSDKGTAKGNSYIHRSVTIDGEQPFEEAGDIIFPSSSEWSVTTLGTEQESYPVYLTKGPHLLGIEVDAAKLIPVAEEITALNDRVNQISLDIRKIIGNNSDLYRDWDLLQYMPKLKEELLDIAGQLDAQAEVLKELNQGNDKTKEVTNLKIASKQLTKMAEDPNQIPNHMSMLSEGSGSVGQTLGDVTEGMIKQPLSMDQIYLWQEGAALPDYQSGIFTRIAEETKYFFSSFGKSSENEQEEKEITVWVNRARNYIDLLQKITDAGFTKDTGIKVNFSIMPNEQKLILANTTNTQPDVALGVSSHLPYDLAIRGAVSDLRQFDGFNETAAQFNPGAFITHTYEDGIYALPETQDFNVLFYRKDLFEKLNIPVPDTWDDVIEILPELQRYGMNFYAPMSLDNSFKTFSTTLPFFYQKGATIYSPDGQSVAVNSEEGLSAMKFMTDLYTVYGVPAQVANFYQQFRNGTIPVGVSGFATYLKLDAAAAELDGAWDIAPMPGFKDENGVVNRFSTGGGQTSVIFSKSGVQEESWEFLKWWTSTDVQLEFGTQMNLLYGNQYLWNSANLEAFEQMPIDEKHKQVILEQWEWLYEFPKTPASYMVEREISNVFNKIVFDGENARSALDDGAVLMNQELDRKLEEFGYRKNGKPVKDYRVPTIELIESWVNEDGEN